MVEAKAAANWRIPPKQGAAARLGQLLIFHSPFDVRHQVRR
jgi:hypothetical protein